MPPPEQKFSRSLLFVFFFVSGFCSLVYQVIWTRLAFASFGVITPVLSVVISVFMLGLSLGSWAGGRFIAGMVRRTGLSAATFYAGVEILVGLSAFAVPKLFALGEHVLLSSGGGNSFQYLSLSALVLALSILPWCVCMGATFPLMMAYIRERKRRRHGQLQLFVRRQRAGRDDRHIPDGSRVHRTLRFSQHTAHRGGGQFHHRARKHGSRRAPTA